MRPAANLAAADASSPAERVARLAREASIEVSELEIGELGAASAFLAPGQRVYVSYLPKQTWTRSFDLCARLAREGFDPVPHVPVRLLRDRAEWETVLRHLRDCGVREPLLISGDYAKAEGPFSSVCEVLESGGLSDRGFARVSFAGHPEGHPAVPEAVIREAQIAKWRQAKSLGLEVSFVTQFFFAADAFSRWASDLRSAGVEARLVAGLAGPVGLRKLVRLATRCGVGASLRALTTRAASSFKLLADHDPASLLQDLASEAGGVSGLPDGIHLFSFGGLVRTASWLRRCEIRSPA
jgi:methylenetetrahydrofolate reductase (NADPH)